MKVEGGPEGGGPRRYIKEKRKEAIKAEGRPEGGRDNTAGWRVVGHKSKEEARGGTPSTIQKGGRGCPEQYKGRE